MSEAATPQQAQSTEAELIAVRREKLAKLRDLGIDPYGARFEVSTTPAELRANFEETKQVKIAGRITALADVFDALGRDRCYKKAWPLEQIIELIRTERGQQFDPALVDILLNNLEAFLAIRDAYPD